MANTSYELMFFNALKNGQTELRSTYDVWLSIGNIGTPQDFLDSLKGASAYETWLTIEGNEGKTEEEFLAAMGGVTPEELTAETTARQNGDTQTLNSAKAYTDAEIAKLGDQVTFTVQGDTLIITPVTQ